jgi:hypothetical protein
VGTTPAALFLTAAILFTLAAHADATNAATATLTAQANGRALITTASGVRLREQPDADALLLSLNVLDLTPTPF